MFAHLGIGFGGTEDEVEVTGEGLGDGLDAAGAEDLEVALVGGAEADVVDLRVGAALFAAVLDEEVGLAFYRERRDLADVGGVFEESGSDGLVDF